MSLGGKLTVIVAAVYLGVFALMAVLGHRLPDGLGLVPWCVWVVLSLPLAGGMVSSHGPGDIPDLLVCLLLLGVNFFLWGYGLSGLWRLVSCFFGDVRIREFPAVNGESEPDSEARRR